MAIPMAKLPEGTRVRIRRTNVPLEPGLEGRTGTVVIASDYATKRLGVLLDGDDTIRIFMPEELVVTKEVPLAPERQTAKLRPPLP